MHIRWLKWCIIMMTQHWVTRMIPSKTSNKMIGLNFHLVGDLLTAWLAARSLLLKLRVYKRIKSWWWWGASCPRMSGIKSSKEFSLLGQDNFRGNPLCQATKWHWNNGYTVKNDEKWGGKFIHLLFLDELWCFPVQCLEDFLIFFSVYMTQYLVSAKK